MPTALGNVRFQVYASLERPDIGWIADGMIVDFHDRNPDVEDPTAAERQRRRRSRDKILRKLGELARAGFISENERTEVENRLSRLDHAQLINLQIEIEGNFLPIPVTRDSHASRRDSVTPPADQIEAPFSGASDAQDVTRDCVTVTLDQNRQYKSTQSATISNAASAELAGLAKEESRIVPEEERDPAAWLKEKGIDLIMDRMEEPPERAAERLSGWAAQVHDSAVLVDILQQAQDRNGPSFHMAVADQIRRQAH
jgi:hypothetical protein